MSEIRAAERETGAVHGRGKIKREMMRKVQEKRERDIGGEKRERKEEQGQYRMHQSRFNQLTEQPSV